MNYKYCLLAAGTGGRNFYSRSSHKGLLPINNRAVISLIFERLDKNIPIVIAVGHKNQLLQEYIQLAHPELDVSYVLVDKITGPGSGPGYSLWKCFDELQCPFVLLNCDSYLEEVIPPPDQNWLGVSSVTEPEPYCLVGTREGLVETLIDKPTRQQISSSPYTLENLLEHAFIGLAGIKDYEKFWTGLKKGVSNSRKGELQVSNGFIKLLDSSLTAVNFPSWMDTGNDKAYEAVLAKHGRDQFLLKPGEFIYFEKGQVLKYFSDSNIVKDRIYRASILKGKVPEIVKSTNHFYLYDYIPGETLPKTCDQRIFNTLLEQCGASLFKAIPLSKTKQEKFRKDCREFYFDKTMSRLEQFYDTRSVKDEEHIINGVKVKRLDALLSSLDWDTISDGSPSLFHGDFQPENIIVHGEGITLIDWRQGFNKCLDYGDLYYDFGKMYHALIITAGNIRNNQFEIHIDKNEVVYHYDIKSNLLAMLHDFEKYLASENYDLEKVQLICALVFLNIAPLHHSPYSELLYFVGKRFLHNILYSDGALP